MQKQKTVHQVVDHLFRHEYGSIVAGLTNRFGIHHLEWIEDAVQESLLRAMKLWSFDTMPEKPGHWLYRVAYNQMTDRLRRENRSVELLEQGEGKDDPVEVRTGKEIEDEQLKMIFACCNPLLEERDSLLLSLKLIGGFSTTEIARALLLKDETAKKSVQRASRHFREKVQKLYFPGGETLKSYLDRVLKVIYLVFNEGYKASSGEDLVKEDLCGEAIRLGLLLADHPYCNDSRILALISLMSFKASRFESRVDKGGELILLEDQDHGNWNRELIQWGFYYFNRASVGQTFTTYHLEAAIEFYYHIAGSYKQIDWKAILNIYERLLQLRPEPITRLNYLVVYEKVEGPVKTLPQLKDLENNLGRYYMYHAVMAAFTEKTGQTDLAEKHIRKAIGLSQNKVEKDLLEKRLIKLMGKL